MLATSFSRPDRQKFSLKLIHEKVGFLLSQQAQLSPECGFPGVFLCWFVVQHSSEQPAAVVWILSSTPAAGFHLQKRAVSQNPNPGSHHTQIPVEPPVGIYSMFSSCNIGPHH